MDRVPDAPGVMVVLGAAHGFKYATVLGRVAAELSLDGETPQRRAHAFRMDRPILLERHPATTWSLGARDRAIPRRVARPGSSYR